MLLKLSRGATYRAGARSVYLFLSGTGIAHDAEFRRWTALHLDAEETVDIVARDEAEILRLVLPDCRARGASAGVTAGRSRGVGMLPSLYASGDGARAWSLVWAATYGAGIGALAALVKMFALHARDAAGTSIWEIAGAALALALLCAGAAALRNFLARRLIWPQGDSARR
jgi:hypothetical protein